MVCHLSQLCALSLPFEFPWPSIESGAPEAKAASVLVFVPVARIRLDAF